MNKVFSALVPLVITGMFATQSVNAAIVEADIDSPPGLSSLTAAGTLFVTDADNDGSLDDLPIIRVTFTLDRQELVTIDADIEGFDSKMYLFDDLGNVLEENDNESRFEWDSYIATTLDAGSYMVALGANNFQPEDVLTGFDINQARFGSRYDGPEGAYGTWALTINASPTEVPVPAALPLFLSAVLGLGVMARRR